MVYLHFPYAFLKYPQNDLEYLIQNMIVTACNKQQDFKRKYSTDKLHCIRGTYNLIAIIKTLNISWCIYNEMCY